jgi:energy-converting hydrogenase B subunit D
VTAIIGVALTLVLLGGTAVVLTEKPTRQAIMLSAYGIMLSILFLSLSAPDVALSQIGVGTAVVPLVVMLAIKRIQTRP